MSESIARRNSANDAVWVCPVCGEETGDPNMLCSGGFEDDGHPCGVRPVPQEGEA